MMLGDDQVPLSRSVCLCFSVRLWMRKVPGFFFGCVTATRCGYADVGHSGDFDRCREDESF